MYLEEKVKDYWPAQTHGLRHTMELAQCILKCDNDVMHEDTLTTPLSCLVYICLLLLQIKY